MWFSDYKYNNPLDLVTDIKAAIDKDVRCVLACLMIFEQKFRSTCDIILFVSAVPLVPIGTVESSISYSYQALDYCMRYFELGK